MSKFAEIQKRALFTIGLLMLYRLLTFIPIPFIDIDKLLVFAEATKKGVFGMFNAFSGGSVSRASIFSLGIMPYITSSIIVQLLTSTSPEYKKLKQESHDIWQKKVNNYTKYLAVIVGLGQGFAFSSGLISMGLNTNLGDFEFKVFTAICMIAGTFSTIWFAETISAFGIGNGTSLIIAIGIVAEAPSDLYNVFYMSKTGAISIIVAIMLIVAFVVNVIFVIFVEKSQRLIHIQYPRQANTFAAQQQSPFLPLKINLAGVIPPIFSGAVLLLPVTVAGFFKDQSHPIVYFIMSNFVHGKPVFIGIYISLVFLFSILYNNIVFDPTEISEQLRRSNVFVPGSRPGKPTAELLKSITKRLSVIGGVYLCIICIVPEVLSRFYGYSFLIGGTGILIVVNVITETMTSVQSDMLSSKYSKVMKKYRK